MKRTYFLRTILVPLFCLLSVNSVTSCDNISGTWVVPYEDDGTLIGEEFINLFDGDTYQLHLYNNGQPIEWSCDNVHVDGYIGSIENTIVSSDGLVTIPDGMSDVHKELHITATCGEVSDYVVIYLMVDEDIRYYGDFYTQPTIYDRGYETEIRVGEKVLLRMGGDILVDLIYSGEINDYRWVYGATYRIIDGAEHVKFERNQITALSPGTFTVIGGINGFHISEPTTFTIVDTPTYPSTITEDIDIKVDEYRVIYDEQSEKDDYLIDYEISDDKYADYIFPRLIESTGLVTFQDLHAFPTYIDGDSPFFANSYQMSTFVLEIKDIDGTVFTSNPIKIYHIYFYLNDAYQIDIEGPIEMRVGESEEVDFTIYPFNGYAYLEFECLNDPDAFDFNYNYMTALKAGEFDVQVKVINDKYNHIETEDNTVRSNIIKVYVTE